MYIDVNEIIGLTKKSPKALEIYQGIKSFIEEEKAKRQQFYKEVSEDEKAEFINGEVVLHSPVKFKHSQASMHLAFLIQSFVNTRKIGVVGHEKLMVKFARNDYEPDVCFFNKEKSDQFKPNQMLFPIPDFVAEILSKSTEKTDRGVKFEDYEAHQVMEYWIVDPDKELVEQYLLKDKKYILNQKSGNGTLKSIAIHGFEIPVKAIFDKDLNRQTLHNLLK